MPRHFEIQTSISTCLGDPAPLIFIAHAGPTCILQYKRLILTLLDAIRNAIREGLKALIQAIPLTKQEVRIVAVGDVLQWGQAALLGKF